MTTDSKNGNALCDAILDRLADAIDGELSPELAAHLDSCDACRDLVHDASRVGDRVREAGSGYVAPIDLEERVMLALEAQKPRVSSKGALAEGKLKPSELSSDAAREADRIRASEASASARDPHISSGIRAFGRSVWRQRRSVGASFALAAAVAIGAIALRPKPNSQAMNVASAPWRGMVSQVVVGGEGDGLLMVDEAGATRALHRGDSVGAGAHLRTDVRTRARIELDDGSAIVLDRGADVVLDKSQNRTARLASGSMVIEVPSVDDAAQVTPAKLVFPGGSFSTTASRVSLATLSGGNGKPSTSVTVARGAVDAQDDAGHSSKVGAGEGGTVGGGALKVGTTGGLASAFAWSELGEVELGEKADVQGLGELRARLPGAKDDGDKALKLSKQSVKVRISGEVARTEIEETFSSDDPQILEGIFRFPLPPDAQIERLALDVDGKLEDGAFVDKERGAAIWRGVTYKTASNPIQPKPQEEWVWVSGPWRDPALLEWRAGGRMELKIYPIPAHGSRRVVLAYTQRIAPSSGLRRYVYPLPHFTTGATSVDDFSLDVQVMGHDDERGVRVRGYDVTSAPAKGGVVHASFAQKKFVPAGDLVIEYSKAQEGAIATTYAYRPTTGGSSYVALEISPSLPRLPDGTSRTQVIVVDSSRSMVGERWTRATALAARVVEEMDPRDRFAVLACDVSCAPMAITSRAPSKRAAEDVRTFLAGITPDGASDLVSAVKSAAAISHGEKGRSLRVVYVGDGSPSIGARTPSEIESGVRSALSDEASVTAVAIGVDADSSSLEALARGGGGVVVPYVAGEQLGAAALSILEATYGVALRDPQLTLPAGLEEVAPSRLGALRAGEETLVVARTTAAQVEGTVTLKGTLSGKPWSTSFSIAVRPSSDEGNAFVPRLFAAATIDDLERRAGDADKARIVELSKTFAVPSRYTSLIVLESPAMAAAFGVKSTAPISTWTGEESSIGVTTGLAFGDADRMSERATANEGKGSGYGGAPSYDDIGGANAGPAATATMAPTKKPAPPPVASKAAKPSTAAIDPVDAWGGGGGGGYYVRMVRQWYRTASFADATQPADLETAIGKARGLAVASPDSRDKLADLFGLLSRRESLDEADQVMAKWITRDPLDARALLARSDLAAREGDRAHAIRIETGALDARPDDPELADGLAAVALREGDSKLACALRSVRADVRPNDALGVARRIACLRSTGDDAAANVVLEALDGKRRPLVEAKIAAAASETLPAANGDLVVDATWSSGAPADVDLAIIDAKGVRTSWLSTGNVRVADATSTSHEAIAIPWAQGGSYAIEVTQPGDAASSSSINGTVVVRILGEAHSYSFSLHGARTTVGRVNVNWASRLVPE